MPATPSQIRLPVYFLIQQAILEQIQHDLLKPGEQLKSEMELAQRMSEYMQEAARYDELSGQLLPGANWWSTLLLDRVVTLRKEVEWLGLDPESVDLNIVNGIQSELDDPVPLNSRECLYPLITGGYPIPVFHSSSCFQRKAILEM